MTSRQLIWRLSNTEISPQAILGRFQKRWSLLHSKDKGSMGERKENEIKIDNFGKGTFG